MLYAFFGTDTVGVREQALAFMKEREAKGASVSRIAADAYEEGSVVAAAGGMTLFGEEAVVLIDTPSENEKMSEEFFAELALLKESPHTFVLVEGKLLAPAKKKIEKYAEECIVVDADKKEASFNVFALSDALYARDKKTLWMLLVEARSEGVAAEQVAGLLFAALRGMRLAEQTHTADEAGMKSYPYNKAKSALRKFKEGEVTKFSRELLALYHDGHLGKRDMFDALEGWVLEV